MLNKFDGTLGLIISILLFPTFFQDAFFSWAWGANDDVYIMLVKRLFLLLPVAAIVFGCWITIGCIFTVIIRQERRRYVGALFVTWWDLMRAIFTFWSGIFKFLFFILGWILAFLRITIVGIWLAIQDILLTPLRAIRGMGENAFRPGVPWVAVWMTLLWCALEAFIFTFVMTSLVVDTLSGLTGMELNIYLVQVCLYFMLLAFVVGSYAILSTLEAAIQSRQSKQIATILIIEGITLIFEVLFLYREFVDALVPWFAQHAGDDFSMGIFSILLLATFVWAGIRGMTWFLFAASGTPTIMAIIQRTGLRNDGGKSSGGSKTDHFVFIKQAVDVIKKDINWCHEKGDEVISAFVLPPLQIIAASINFCTLLITANHLFEIPFKSYKEVLSARELIKKVKP